MRSFIDKTTTCLKSRLRVSSSPITCKPCSGSPVNATIDDAVRRSMRKKTELRCNV